MVIKAVIEMQAWSSYKYEMDKETGRLVLDRPLTINIPANYGYVPDTLAPDGDPLDIFVVADGKVIPGSIVKASIVGLFVCNDNGDSDDKLLGFLQGETYYDQGLMIDQIKEYLTNYKEGFQVLEYRPVESFDLAAYLKEVSL